MKLKWMLLIIATSALLLTIEAQATDWACMNRCTASGSMYGYCQSICGGSSSGSSYSPPVGVYNPPAAQSQTDYQCLSRCQAQGSGWNFCQSKCSY